MIIRTTLLTTMFIHLLIPCSLLHAEKELQLGELGPLSSSAQDSDLPVIGSLREFDVQSGSFRERLVVNHRPVVVVLCILVTLVLGYQASKITLQAGFEKILPKAHPFVLSYQANENHLKGLGNNLRVVAEVKDGDIFIKESIEFIEQVSDALFYIPGVDSNGMKSSWTPDTRWQAVTKTGNDTDGGRRQNRRVEVIVANPPSATPLAATL